MFSYTVRRVGVGPLQGHDLQGGGAWIREKEQETGTRSCQLREAVKRARLPRRRSAETSQEASPPPYCSGSTPLS